MTSRKSVPALYRCLILAGAICCSSCQSVTSGADNKPGQNESKPRVFSPRMDYDEWTPLGRGDPLKNNPTFDYVPPVLDRVQYWLDSHTTESSLKRDVLVLGVTAKKTSPKIPEQFLKFVDGPKFTKTASQETAPYRNDFTGSGGAEPPKLLRTTSFRNGPTMDYRNQNRIQSMPASYYPSPFYGHKSKPYTMMLPPPLLQKDKIVSFVEPTQQFSTQTEEGPVLREPSQFYVPSKGYNGHPPPPPTKSQSQSQSQSQPQSQSFKSVGKGGHVVVSQVETIKSLQQASSTPQPQKSRPESVTAPSVSFEKSNLIYQSTQTVSSGWPNSAIVQSTPSTASDQPLWQGHDYNRDRYELDHHVAASSNHHEVVVDQQNANIIVDGDSGENEEVIVGQKEAVPSLPAPLAADFASSGDQTHAETEEKMHIVLANASGSSEIDKAPVAVVMPTNYSEKKPSFPTFPETGSPEASPTAEPEAASNRRPEPSRNAAAGSPMMSEESVQHQSVQFPGMMPNRMMQPHRQPYPEPGPLSGPFSGAVLGPVARPQSGSMHAFAFPQAPLQSMMHPQPRPNHAMMQFLGSMRPGVGFRVPSPMGMFPPMTHIHAPPVKSHHPMEPHQQEFSMTFTESPVASSLSGQLVELGMEEDRHRSRLPDTTAPIATTPSPLPPTISSMEHSSTQNSPLGSILTKEKEEETPPATPSPQQVTTVQSLTTDPIFSHYKQPAKPIRGPMYLIIQGHSKVKTYKPTVTKHGLPLAKSETKETVTERQLSKFEQFIKENTKSGNASAAAAEKKKAEEKARAEKIAQARQNSLMSLVESGLGSFAVSPSPSSPSSSSSSSPSSSATLPGEEEYQPNSVTTIEINGN
nr:flocculation protein FLO11 isoform X2 [Megalopta genalis]